MTTTLFRDAEDDLAVRLQDARQRETALRAQFDEVQAERRAIERTLQVRRRVIDNERRRLRAHLAHGVTCTGSDGSRSWRCACGAAGSLRRIAAASARRRPVLAA